MTALPSAIPPDPEERPRADARLSARFRRQDRCHGAGQVRRRSQRHQVTGISQGRLYRGRLEPLRPAIDAKVDTRSNTCVSAAPEASMSRIPLLCVLPTRADAARAFEQASHWNDEGRYFADLASEGGVNLHAIASSKWRPAVSSTPSLPTRYFSRELFVRPSKRMRTLASDIRRTPPLSRWRGAVWPGKAHGEHLRTPSSCTELVGHQACWRWTRTIRTGRRTAHARGATRRWHSLPPRCPRAVESPRRTAARASHRGSKARIKRL